MTQAHLDELSARIDELYDRLLDDPECRATAILLSACIDNYNAKLRLLEQPCAN
tara:strand:+ start:417 stop:578 length:162 start_codon:yes stop_codon:yes gene_type:complete